MKQKIIPVALLVLLSLLVTLLFFYPLTGHLNTVLFTGGGDGIKNYFTYLFYIQNDTGTHFTGMNYPFGEDVVFTDNMPLLAWIVKALSHYFPTVAAHGLGIMHASLLTALTIGSIFLYKILKKFGVADWWAIPSALFILYFSPQLFKLTGFFGMAYLMYLPMLLYWLMQYHQNGKLKYPVYIGLLTIIFTFLHVYQLAFTLVLCSCYILAYFIVRRKATLKSKLFKILPLLVLMFLSWACFAVYLKFFDLVTDRTTYPYGVFGVCTTRPDIFTSNIAPLGFVFQFLFGKAHGPSESYTYIGFISILISIFLLYKIIRAVILKSWKQEKVPTHPIRAYRVWLWVALFELLFSMGIPFVWHLEFLADYVSALRQFRSMGRFSWSFYYIFLVFCAVFLYRLYKWLYKKSFRWQGKALLVAVIIIWGIQLSGYVQWIRENIVVNASSNYDELYSKKEGNWNQWLKQKGYDASQFQAVLALPFFHIGSEKLWLQDNDEGRTMFYGAQFALQTGVPMIDVRMSRTSWSQTFASVQLVDGPLSAKPLLDSFASKPVVVLVNKHFPLKPKETEWVNRATFIGSREDLDLYAANVNDLVSNGKRIRDSIQSIARQKSRQEGLIGNDTAFYFADHFDKTVQPETFEGPGAFNPKERKKEQVIATIQPGFSDSGSHHYFFSIWVHCDSTDYRSPYFIFRQYDKEGQLIKESDLNTKYSTHIIDHWYLADKVLTLEKEMTQLKIFVVGPEDYFALDELAFWPANCIYYYKPDDHSVLLNNRPQ